MTETALPAITPTPLSNYLTAIGLFRVISEQLDPRATCAWVRDELVIGGPSIDEIVAFMTGGYAPTPVFSPWNKEGDPTQNATTADQIDTLLGLNDDRFDRYRSVISAWNRLESSGAWARADKAERLALWRAAAPDDALGWIDAAVAVSATRPEFPPLLGSGGNDGRFEFSRLLHGELVRLFADPRQAKRAEGWLRSLLTGSPGPALVDSTLGMYDGNAAGTPNSSPQGSANSASNPWAIVLTFEGLIGFGASIASRAGSAQRQLVGAPFMVRPSRLGDDSAAGEDARGELWAPLWTRPVRWHELRRTIAEGRLSWGGRQASSAADASRSVASLAVDRGIDAFVRHQIVQRNGLSYVATPAGRVTVQSNPGALNLAAIDPWVRNARRVSGAGVERASRQLDRALIAAAAGGSSGPAAPIAFQEVLAAVVALEHAAGRSSAGRTNTTPFPNMRGEMPRLDVDVWRGLINDDTAEFRIAMALASLATTVTTDRDVPFQSMSLALRGLSGSIKGPRWAEAEAHRDPAAAAALRAGDRAPVEVLRRRLQAAHQQQPADGDNDGTQLAGYTYGRWVPLDDVLCLLDGTVDIERTLRLARCAALLARRIPGTSSGADTHAETGGDSNEEPNADGAHEPERPSDRLAAGRADDAEPPPVDPWFAAVRLCLLGRDDRLCCRKSKVPTPPTKASSCPLNEGTALPFARRRWGRLLEAGRLDEIGAEALTALARTGHTHLRRALPPTADPNALAVALLVRLRPSDQHRLAKAIADPIYQGVQEK